MQEKLEKEIYNNSCKMEYNKDKMNFTVDIHFNSFGFIASLSKFFNYSRHGWDGSDSFLLIFMGSYENLVNSIIFLNLIQYHHWSQFIFAKCPILWQVGINRGRRLYTVIQNAWSHLEIRFDIWLLDIFFGWIIKVHDKSYNLELKDFFSVTLPFSN